VLVRWRRNKRAEPFTLEELFADEPLPSPDGSYEDGPPPSPPR
jgi:hypothetical protein